MTPVYCPLELLTDECTWETNGQSPQHSPQAMIQFGSQILVPLSANPQSGIDVNALARALAQNSPFANMKGIVLSEQELEQKQVDTIRKAIGQNAGGMVGQPPQVGDSGVPQTPFGGGGAPPTPGGGA